MSFATMGDCITVGSFSTGGSTLIKVLAVYFGLYLFSRNQLTPPQPKPNTVKKNIINQCLRNIARISFGVNPAAAPRAAITGLGVITLGSPIIGLGPASAIYAPIKLVSRYALHEHILHSIRFS
jgi:hypothetical protein